MKKILTLFLLMLSAITLHTTAAPAWSDMKRIERQIVAP